MALAAALKKLSRVRLVQGWVRRACAPCQRTTARHSNTRLGRHADRQ